MFRSICGDFLWFVDVDQSCNQKTVNDMSIDPLVNFFVRQENKQKSPKCEKTWGIFIEKVLSSEQLKRTFESVFNSLFSSSSKQVPKILFFQTITLAKQGWIWAEIKLCLRNDPISNNLM